MKTSEDIERNHPGIWNVTEAMEEWLGRTEGNATYRIHSKEVMELLSFIEDLKEAVDDNAKEARASSRGETIPIPPMSQVAPLSQQYVKDDGTLDIDRMLKPHNWTGLHGI